MSKDTAGKAIHFGSYVYWGRVGLGDSQKAFGAKAGISDKRVWDIEEMAEPRIYGKTKARIAKALGIDPQQFDRVWQSTPVLPKPLIVKKKTATSTLDLSPLHKLAKRHNRPAQEILKEALAFWVERNTADKLVDHKQDPADATQDRLTEMFEKHKRRTSNPSVNLPEGLEPSRPPSTPATRTGKQR